ncbi:DUF3987 domain-containing protein [Aliiruegeria lutimaris]|uniref:DUF3987 domain-containing protein n=1 Tax=Aliiruegeria lutimaris TaxID=571298 RepID=A0A1G9MFA2_9RHOB|nr:DUF3987 domain-containing protein [Aliiruegeria lutimaris]SDL72681.1 Protein of unknown function [Aliiruegeria lutimaris]
MSKQTVIEIIDHDGGMDGRFSRPPGALGRAVAVGHAMCPRDNRWSSLAGALAALSAITKNRYVVAFNGMHVRLNLYVADVEPTASGKETGRTLARLLTSAADTYYTDDIVSKPALHEVLSHKPQMLACIDEFGRYLAEARADSSSHRGQMMTFMMTLYGLAGSFLSERTYAKKTDTKPLVDKPFLSALLSTTPERLEGALGSTDVVDGTMNRLTMILAGNTTPPFKPLGRKSIPNDKLPADLDEMCKRIAKGPPLPEEKQGDDLGLDALSDPEGGTVTMDEALERQHDQFMREMDARKDKGGSIGPMWGRAAEQVLRVAGVMTVADTALAGDLIREIPMRPEIYQWAQAFVVNGIDTLEQGMAADIVDTPLERMRRSIMKAIEKREGKPPKHNPGVGWVRYVDVSGAVRSGKSEARTSKAVEDEIEMLIEDGVLERCHWPKKTAGGSDIRPMKIVSWLRKRVNPYPFD